MRKKSFIIIIKLKMIASRILDNIEFILEYIYIYISDLFLLYILYPNFPRNFYRSILVRKYYLFQNYGQFLDNDNICFISNISDRDQFIFIRIRYYIIELLLRNYIS